MNHQEFLDILRQRKFTFASAESCTGGNIAHVLTSISGASDVVKGGVVSYCNEVKNHVLGVSQDDLDRFTAVSEPVALQMAIGVLNLLNVDLAVSTTGVAGPGGGTPQSPVGTVWIGIALRHPDKSVSAQAFRCHFSGSRLQVIEQATDKALQLALSLITNNL